MSMLGASGGIGGDPFNTESPRDDGPWKIGAIQVWSDNTGVNAIEIRWISQKEETRYHTYGDRKGEEYEYRIGADDHLVKITGSLGLRHIEVYRLHVSSLRFFTRKGHSSPVIGMESNVKFQYDEIPGYQIIDLFGRAGSDLDALGVGIEPIPSPPAGAGLSAHSSKP